MFETPNHEMPRGQGESHHEEYDRLLDQGLKAQTLFQELGEQARRLNDVGRSGEAEEIVEHRHELDEQINGCLAQRVALLREIEKVTTIEDAFPRLKTGARRQEDEGDRHTQVIPFRGLSAGPIGANRVLVVGEYMDLTKAEWPAFLVARIRLARLEGYETKSTDPKSIAFSLERNGIVFTMSHFAYRSAFGIGGYSRISKIRAVRKEEEEIVYLRYDHGWDTACRDPQVQREIDRVIAVFG